MIAGSRPRIAYLDGRRLRRALLAGVARVTAERGHLDRINVFPVADGDTGTNLSLTLSAIAERVASADSRHAGEILSIAADAALDGARGNSGAIFAQYFQGLAAELRDRERIAPDDILRALSTADRMARAALADPREGTVLTVMTAAATSLASPPAPSDFTEVIDRVLGAARAAEADTRNTLDLLREAGVVDAGALGLLLLFEGMADALQPGVAPPYPTVQEDAPLPMHLHGEGDTPTHRYCTECVITGEAIDPDRLRTALAAIGSSVVVVGGARKARLHCHVDEPAAAFGIARRWGTLSGEKADDMHRQERTLAARGQRVAVVTDSAADLPEELWDELGLQMVPLRVIFGTESHLDRIGLPAARFLEELAINPVHPRTSQPPPGDFRRAYELLSSHFEHVVVITLGARLSGTHQAAVTAARAMADRVTVLDSRTASAGQGLIALYAAELARAGLGAAEVVARTEGVIGRTHTWGFVPGLGHAARGGRLPQPWRWLAGRLPVALVAGTDGQGHVRVHAVRWRRADPVRTLLGVIRRDTEAGLRYRLSIAHAGIPDAAAGLASALETAFPDNAGILLAELGAVLGVHGGPGTLIVAAQALPDQAAWPLSAQMSQSRIRVPRASRTEQMP